MLSFFNLDIYFFVIVLAHKLFLYLCNFIGPVVCKDLKPLDKCLRKKGKNHCETKYDFMYRNCRDTCGWCDEEEP